MSDTRISNFNVIDQSGRPSQDQIQDQITEVKARNDVLQQRAQSYLGLSNTTLPRKISKSFQTSSCPPRTGRREPVLGGFLLLSKNLKVF